MSNVILGGYSPDKELAAQQLTRGGKTVYIVSLPIQLVPILLPVPDPLHPWEGNRAVRKRHAEEFGLYWLHHADSWTVPPLLVDTPNLLEFRENFEIKDGPRLGTVTLPQYSNQILNILDGQHRVLGWSLVGNKLMADMRAVQEQRAQLARTGTDLEKQEIAKRLETINFGLNRLKSEQVTVEIITGVTKTEHQTFFVTIADNALGINQSERTRLDETNMTSRVAKQILDTVPLLKGRVETRKGSVSKKSKDLMSIANLRDIVSHVCLGIKGRMTAAREKDFVDSNAQEMVEHFFRAMIESVPMIKDVEEMKFLPSSLRDESLLGSVTIWRCLAGSYHDLAVKVVDNRLFEWDKSGHDKFVKMMSELHKRMKISQKNGQKSISPSWYETGCFKPQEISAGSRSQDLRNLSGLFTEWAKNGTLFQPKRLPKR